MSVAIASAALTVLSPNSTVAASDWSVVTSPNQGAGGNLLYGVSCTSSSSCVAVGYYRDGSNVAQTLVETWNGTAWSIASSPNQGTANNILLGVSCASSSSCVAVGFYYNGSNVTQTLVETWNGTSWSVTSSPNVGTGGNLLYGVSCVSSSSCVAVGYASVTQTLIESWNASTWTIVSSPNQGTGANQLMGVSCASSTSCVAAGAYVNAGFEQTLVESWNGSSWSIVASPNQGTGVNNALSGASCTSSSSCVAVGSYSTSTGDRTLVETWNGASWSITTSPDQGGDYLTGVSCASSSSCLAVGVYFNGSNVGQTLVETWNGTSWSITSSPNVGTSDNNLNGVTCASSSSCVAVGFDSNGANVGQTLVETGPVSLSTTFQDSSVSIPYNSWHGFTDPTANGGTYRASATKDAKVTFKFSGTGITWVTRKGPDQGIASVAIDGTTKGKVDLYATSPKGFSQSYSGLASKTHTIVISVTGTKDTASSGKQVAVDAFVVGFTTTQDSSTKVTYDSWTGAKSTPASGGTYRVSPKVGATSSLSFTGERVDWITATGPSAGMASVTIDGVSKGTVDLYAPSVHWLTVESYTGLAPGSHTVIVTVLGTKNPSSAGTQVVVDAFVVLS